MHIIWLDIWNDFAFLTNGYKIYVTRNLLGNVVIYVINLITLEAADHKLAENFISIPKISGLYDEISVYKHKPCVCPYFYKL